MGIVCDIGMYVRHTIPRLEINVHRTQASRSQKCDLQLSSHHLQSQNPAYQAEDVDGE